MNVSLILHCRSFHLLFSNLFFINKLIFVWFCHIIVYICTYLHIYLCTCMGVCINFRRYIRWIYKSADAISSSCCRKSFRFRFYSASFVCMFACVLLFCFVCFLYFLGDLHILYTLYYLFTGYIDFFKISLKLNSRQKNSLISDICRHRL